MLNVKCFLLAKVIQSINPLGNERLRTLKGIKMPTWTAKWKTAQEIPFDIHGRSFQYVSSWFNWLITGTQLKIKWTEKMWIVSLLTVSHYLPSSSDFWLSLTTNNDHRNTHPWTDTPLRIKTPPLDRDPGKEHGTRQEVTSYTLGTEIKWWPLQWSVHILLECILVLFLY